MLKLLATALIASSVLAGAAMAADAPACKTSPKVVGKCMTFYGPLAVYSGSPSLRIWPVGTKQLYGLRSTGADPETVALPEKLREILATNPREVNGKWEVCPLEAERPNQLRIVCLESASELRAVPRAATTP